MGHKTLLAGQIGLDHVKIFFKWVESGFKSKLYMYFRDKNPIRSMNTSNFNRSMEKPFHNHFSWSFYHINGYKIDECTTRFNRSFASRLVAGYLWWSTKQTINFSSEDMNSIGSASHSKNIIFEWDFMITRLGSLFYLTIGTKFGRLSYM